MPSYQEPVPRGPQPPAEQAPRSKDSVVIKVGMVGDAQIGKTSLMVKYVEGSWDEDYIQTLGGVNFAFFFLSSFFPFIFAFLRPFFESTKSACPPFLSYYVGGKKRARILFRSPRKRRLDFDSPCKDSQIFTKNRGHIESANSRRCDGDGWRERYILREGNFFFSWLAI
jgi:hypothetical protein